MSSRTNTPSRTLPKDQVRSSIGILHAKAAKNHWTISKKANGPSTLAQRQPSRRRSDLSFDLNFSGRSDIKSPSALLAFVLRSFVEKAVRINLINRADSKWRFLLLKSCSR